jgi:GNAT superfamily N-acetyltransferase
MLFADDALARRIEAAECRLMTDYADAVAARAGRARVFVAALADGVAVHVGEPAPCNKLIGAGLAGPLDAEAGRALAAIERELDARDTPVQAEIATLADGSALRLFVDRGYALVAFENVLGLRLDEALVARLAAAPPPAALTLEVAGSGAGANADADAERAWIETLVEGFGHPDLVPGGPSHEAFDPAAITRAMADMAATPGFVRYLARWDGALAGGGGVRLTAGIAQLCGAATLPAWRRRGVQGALLARRLLDARAAGCDLAVITTQPGSPSQHNVQRQGFALLYARAILVRTPGGARAPA